MKETVEAIVMTAPGRPLERRRFPAPGAKPGGAVLKTVASEVCGTDVHLHHGRLSGVPYPIIPGHVNCGRVLETNGPLRDVEGRRIETGTLVTFFDVSARAGTAGTAWSRRPPRAAPIAGSTASRLRRKTDCSGAGRSKSRSFRE